HRRDRALDTPEADETDEVGAVEAAEVADVGAAEVAGAAQAAGAAEVAGAAQAAGADRPAGWRRWAPGRSTPRAPASRAGAARRTAWPTLLVLFLAWLPPLIDQVHGEGNLGRLFRWARGDDIGGGMGSLTEGHLDPRQVVESAAWLLHPTGLWAG